ncbi:acyltransferase [Bacillus timonensis]|uniref:acyltransferase n=1 Tax=Bacillus timonensis TaxID=1033734 RepID=UPI000289B4B5|nr:acyltransferase [Bacillus timonensis]
MHVDSAATIGENVEIGFGTIIYGNVEIGANTVIGPYSIIGERVAEAYSNKEYISKKTFIGKNSIIRSHSIIYEDVVIGENFQSGHRITIREKTIIGKNCSVGTLCDLQGDLQIGDFVRLHSNVHIGQKSRIEDFVWIYPYVVLTNDPYPPMGELKGVTIKQYAQVATASVILPGITIGENSLIGAYSLVRKNVLPERVIVGVPGKDLCSVRDILNDKKERVYPWKEYLKDFRGYPWQINKDFKNE